MTRDLEVDGAGVTLAVRDHGGDGPPILLLHGAGQNLATWTPMAAHLTARHRVVAMDFRNHGRSASAPWSWAAVLADVGAVLERLQLDKPSLVGHSLGGMVAAMFAEADGACAAAVNLDGHGSGRPGLWVGLEPEVGIAQARQLRELGSRMMPSGRLTPQEARDAQAAVEAAAVGVGMPVDAARETWVRRTASHDDGTMTLRPTRRQMDELLDAIDQLDLFQLYRRVRCPLLVYHAVRLPDLDAATPGDGGLPPWLPAYHAAFSRGIERALAQLAQECPRVRVRTVDLTHGLILEAPQQLAAEVSDFVLDVCKPANGEGIMR